jgi:hypothetical protein
MTDDDPLDVAHVTADHDAIEQLRARSVRPDDPALELLRDLLADVESDLPGAEPVGHGSTVLRLANESTPDPRLVRGGTVVALLAAGVVAFGGVAAASTAVAPGNPLHGLGETVRSAAGALLTAVKPPAPQRRAEPETGSLPTPAATRAAQAVSSHPTARPFAAATSGAEVAAAARSQAAVRQVTALLDEAEQLLGDSRVTAAEQRLEIAERRLADVSPQDADALRDRLTELRARAEAASPAQRPAQGPGSQPDQNAEPQPGPSKPEQAQRPGERAAPKGGRSAGPGEREPGQPSRLASTKPRA